MFYALPHPQGLLVSIHVLSYQEQAYVIPSTLDLRYMAWSIPSWLNTSKLNPMGFFKGGKIYRLPYLSSLIETLNYGKLADASLIYSFKTHI